ncbi:uncharacterized protein LOC132257162 [Phlebotomus argentipes]|uniref:uncharacterized protein LOC132257162 n=1 Tax=Phlebotomus argentipes TaxID=94469 RepID=UPI00289356DB|nr:uncharacterized protein LOC132257162 [Phlebotomus argentipes]
MINGKFFTGLTDKMMRRNGSGPNRQESHMYWPDEATTPSVRESSHRETVLAARRRPSDTPSTSQWNNNAISDDVAPKELVRKQMKSRIEFYDHVDTTKDPIRRPSIDKGFQDQKRQTLSSKIEFYDYVTEPSVTKKSENITRSASPAKVVEKKISFTENQSEKPSSSKKEHIIAIKNDDISKKSNISRKNISKSKSVENLTLKKDDEDMDLHKLNKQVQNLKIGPNGRTEEKIETLKQSKVKPILKTRRVEVEPEEFVYRNGYDYDEMPVRVIKSRVVRPEEEYYYENRVVPAYRNPRIRPEFLHDEPQMILHQPMPIDRYYYQPRETLYREPEPRKRTVKYMIPEDEDRYEKPRSPPPVEPPKSRPVQRSNTVRESPKPSEVPNEARLRAHQHLKSSISFFNDTTTGANTSERKPLSIRDTAVARVGVGLPDI